MEAIILAGGKGTRLGTESPPKALVKVGDRTIIDYRIQHLIKQGIKIFIIAVGYKKKQVKQHINLFYNDSKYDDLKFFFAEEDEPLGTAGAINYAMKYAEDDFVFVTNVDDITDIDLNQLKHYKENVICLSRFRSRFGIVETSKDDVIEFKEKPLLRDLWASCGFYYLSKYIDLPEEGSIERDVFPLTPLKAYKHRGKWFTINSLKDIEEVEKEMLK